MTDHNERRDAELVELSTREMEQAQGGAWYAKFDGVDGAAAARAGVHVGGGGGGAGKVSMRDFHF